MDGTSNADSQSSANAFAAYTAGRDDDRVRQQQAQDKEDKGEDEYSTPLEILAGDLTAKPVKSLVKQLGKKALKRGESLAKETLDKALQKGKKLGGDALQQAKNAIKSRAESLLKGQVKPDGSKFGDKPLDEFPEQPDVPADPDAVKEDDFPDAPDLPEADAGADADVGTDALAEAKSDVSALRQALGGQKPLADNNPFKQAEEDPTDTFGEKERPPNQGDPAEHTMASEEEDRDYGADPKPDADATPGDNADDAPKADDAPTDDAPKADDAPGDNAPTDDGDADIAEGPTLEGAPAEVIEGTAGTTDAVVDTAAVAEGGLNPFADLAALAVGIGTLFGLSHKSVAPPVAYTPENPNVQHGI